MAKEEENSADSSHSDSMRKRSSHPEQNVEFTEFADWYLLLEILKVSYSLSLTDEVDKHIFENIEFEDKRYSGELTPFSLEEVVDGSLSANYFNGSWISSTKILYTDKKSKDLLTFDVKTLKNTHFLNESSLEADSSGLLSPDGSCLLFGQRISKVWRRSSLKKYSIYNLQNKSWSDVANGDNISLAIWSQTGNDLFYVMNNDIYYRQNLNGIITITKLTFDGIPGIVFNGIPDWVYEEEVFESEKALQVSPDGTHLIFASINDTDVDEIIYPIYGEPGELSNQYPLLKRIKYPKVSSKIPTITLNIINLANPNSSLRVLKAPIDVVGREHILFKFSWLTNDTIAAIWTNRVQNTAQIVSYDLQGKESYVLAMKETEGWVIPSELFYHNGYLIFRANQESGTPAGKFMHITRFDLKTSLERKNNPLEVDLTPGPFEVLSILEIDESTGKIYYLATAPGAPSQRNLYSVPINLSGKPTCLSCSYKSLEGRKCMYATAKFSLDKSFYALTCTGLNLATTEIYNSVGDQIFTWEKNEALRRKLSHRLQPSVRKLSVSVNGYECPVKLVLPPGFNENKKYPMVVFVYAGPSSVRVVDENSYEFALYMTTNRTTIYAFMDGRGSGNKGSKMLFEIYRRLGTVEIEDIISITKKLQEKFSWIDPKRTALWGSSYGGYTTAMVLATDTNSVFECGISVAPVTSWIYYNAIYTERYMGLPTVEDNLSAYKKSDLTRLVEGIRGKKFLLIHGTGDDNVHYQNAMVLAKALVTKGILYDSISYPDEDHSLSGVFLHTFYTMDGFLNDCLNLTSFK